MKASAAKPRAEIIGGMYEALEPNEIVRVCDGPRVWGLSHSQIEEKVKLGEIPRPKRFFPTGKASGWTGHVINEHRRKLAALAAANPPPPLSAPRKKAPAAKRSTAKRGSR